MYQFEVRFTEGLWRLTGSGTAGGAHNEPSRDRIEAYVDGFMTLRSGRVTFYHADGAFDREATYEPRDFQLWAMQR